jgi:branched-chain amino acid transport system substrate-binding protein
MAVGGYDGMALIVDVARKLKGKIETDKALAAAKTFKYNSPRGPISIDPETRDIIMNAYLSEVVKGPDGKLRQKVIATTRNVKDPCKALKVGPCA